MGKVLNEGTWFWARVRLFVTPWFPNLNATNMVVTMMPVWVRFPNLPLHF